MPKFNLVVRENGTLMSEVLKEYFTSKLQKRSVFSLYSSTKESLPSIMGSKPFFNNGLLLIVYTEKMHFDDLRNIIKAVKNNEYFSAIYFCNDSKSYNFLVDTLDKETKTINLYMPPDWLLMEYLKYSSPKRYTSMAIQVMYTRLRGQWKYLDNYIQEFNTLAADLITDNDVKGIIPVFTRLNLDNIFEGILLSNLAKKDIKSLYEYKYAYNFMLKEMESRINLLIKLKLDYIAGDLNFKNQEQYYQENKSKISISEYTLKRYMKTLLTQLPTFYLYKWRHIISKYRKIKDGFVLMLLEMGVLG